MVRYGTIDQDYGIRLATTPVEVDGPVWMVNLMHYRQRADYADGRESTLTGREADDRYAPVGPLAAVGAEVVFLGDVELQFLNDDPKWDRVAVVKYPTRRAFVDMQRRPDFRQLHEHKDAGMAATFVIGCQPMPLPDLLDGVVQPDWADVEHPPTSEDGPVMVVHVLRFEQPAGADTPGDMDEYTRHAVAIAAPHGTRIAGWFAAEGTIVGDGRRWDQVRFNSFPSRRAVHAVFFDPARIEAQRRYREQAIADTYTLVVRPVINRL